MKKISLLAIFCLSLYVANAQTTNYQVHSLFLMNIAKYSTWPSPSNEFHIIVFGKSKMFDELVKHSAGKNINGLTIKVTQTENINEVATAQIIFLPDNKSNNLSDILKSIENKPAMIIAEREGLHKKGAGFSFVLMDNNTLRYDINNAELEKRNIKVSKNLAGLANSII